MADEPRVPGDLPLPRAPKLVHSDTPGAILPLAEGRVNNSGISITHTEAHR